MSYTPNILLLDSNEPGAREIQRFLQAGSYQFIVSHTGVLEEGIAALRSEKPDVILFEAQMGENPNFETFRQLVTASNIPVIVISRAKSAGTARITELLNAGEYFVKNNTGLVSLEKAIAERLKIINEAGLWGIPMGQDSSGKQVALLKVLDKTGAGVLILNKENKVLYASPRAYQLLADETLQQRLKMFLTYRPAVQDEELTVKHGNNSRLLITAQSTEWNGADAVIFVIEKKAADTENKALNIEAIEPVLNALNVSILVLDERRILLANTAAATQLNSTPGQLSNALFSDFFEVQSSLNVSASLAELFSEKESKAWLKSGGSLVLPAKLITRPLSVGGTLLHICWFMVQPQMGEEGTGLTGTFGIDSILQLASHDLREPVRTILNYVQLISESLKKNNLESAAEYSEQAKSAASRMEKLLSDFKVFISLKERVANPVSISVKQVALDAVKQLRHTIELSHAEINIADMPVVNADVELLQLLLHHLIDNAVKFHKKGKKPVIDIGCDKYEGKILFCVRDNGIGIAKKYHDKIFEPFERLNRVDEYPGNGMGLAICRKVIGLMGGKIWVESLPGLGSSFYFTLSDKGSN